MARGFLGVRSRAGPGSIARASAGIRRAVFVDSASLRRQPRCDATALVIVAVGAGARGAGAAGGGGIGDDSRPDSGWPSMMRATSAAGAPRSRAARPAPARRDRLAQQLHHVRRALQRLVDHAIEQVLDRPRELADELRADHAAAALQRVERAAHVDAARPGPADSRPTREQALELRDLVLRFLDEQLEEFRIGVAATGARAGGCAAAGRRLRRGSGRCLRRAGIRTAVGRRRPATRGAGPRARWSRRARAPRRAGRLRLERSAGTSPRCRSMYQGSGGRPAASPCSTRPRRSRRRAGRPLRGQRPARAQNRAERAIDAFHDLDDARLAEHQQAGRDAAHQLRNLVERPALRAASRTTARPLP